MTINRIWHGWTSKINADAYHALLCAEVFPGIEAQKIRGFRAITLLRRETNDEVEFVTNMIFDSISDVISFQGEYFERAYIPEAARKLLDRWDVFSQHYAVLEERRYPDGSFVSADATSATSSTICAAPTSSNAENRFDIATSPSDGQDKR
jgi:hypothetical protein